MTNEQINKVIAETCGWIERPTCTDFLGNPLLPPDYCNDLNAMNEAENGLGATQMRHYGQWLQNIYGPIYRATARQRAEAFLKTIGKWEGAQ